MDNGIANLFISNEPKSFFMEVSPELANIILENLNIHNRKIRAKSIAFYANEMLHGDWRNTGDAICISTSGVLLNGQHRLLSIIKSKTTQKMLFAIGLADDTQLVMDTGAGRSVQDNLKLSAGLNYSNQIISAINCASGGEGNRRLSASETKAFITKYKEQIDIITQLFPSAKKGVTKASIIASILLSLINGESVSKVANFVDILTGGKYTELSPGEISVMRLREKILSTSGRTFVGIYRIDEMKLVQKVFQAYKNDSELTKLYVPKSLVYDLINIDDVFVQLHSEEENGEDNF